MTKSLPRAGSRHRGLKGARSTVPATRRAPRATNAPIAPGQLLALFAATDLEALIDAAFPLLRATVPCDFVSAFYRSAGNGLLKSRDSLGREYSAAHMRRHVALNPAIPFAAANRGLKILPTRVGLPGTSGELRKTAFYREIMQPEGWRHSVALCFWGAPAADFPVFVAGVNRSDGAGDFSKREITRLERVHPFIDCAVTRLHDDEAARNVIDSMAIAARGSARGFAILDRHLRLVQASPTARRMCAAWVVGAVRGRPAGDDSRGWRLPPVLGAGCCELHDEWQSAVRANPDVAGPRRSRVVHARNPALTAVITLVVSNATGLAEPSFLLELNRAVHGAALKTPDQSVPVLRRMTPAETAVALVLADGLSNQEIADRLGKSTHAVKFLLHRIYQKTGIPSRAALVAALRAGPTRRSSTAG